MRRIHRFALATTLVVALTACGGDGGTGGADGPEGGAAGSGTTAGTAGNGTSGTATGTAGTGSGTTAGSSGSGGTAGTGTTGGASSSSGNSGSVSGAGAGGTGGSGGGTAGSGATAGAGGTGSAGGSGSTGTSGSGAATPLTLSGSVPANNDGVIDTALAIQAKNEARAADGTFPAPYCALNFLIAPSSNGKLYNVTVYFRQGDAKVLHASVYDRLGLWVVFDTNVNNGIDRVAVDVANRTVRFTQKSLVGAPDPLQPVPLAPTQSTIADGGFGFPVNDSAVVACGV